MDNFKPSKALITALIAVALLGLAGAGTTYFVMKGKIESLKATERNCECVTLDESINFGRASFRFGFNRGFVSSAFETEQGFQELFQKDSLNFERLISEFKLSKNGKK